MSCLEQERVEREVGKQAEMVLKTNLGKMQRWEGLANTGAGNGATGGLQQEGKGERRALATGLHLRHPA